MNIPSSLVDSTLPLPRDSATRRRKVLFNATMTNKGGALQNCTSFILQASSDREFDFVFAISAAVANELRRFGAQLPPAAKVLTSSPARDRTARRDLADFEAAVQPDLVFSFGGPAYVKFRALHLLGCSEPWVTHAGWTAYQSLRFPDEWLRYFLISAYKLAWFRHADAWVMQTETSRHGLHRRAGVPLEHCFVVSNTCGDHYRSASEIRSFPRAEQRIRFLVFAAPYKHKNLMLVPRVAAELKKSKPRLDFEFVFTLPPEGPMWKHLQSAAARLKVANHLTNAGRVAVADGPALYKRCDVCFLPTVLETFSATFVESMAMGLPIVTSDLDFARDACGQAALYFHPRRPTEAADRLVELLESPENWEKLTHNGRNILARMPTARQRFELFCDVFRRVIARRATEPQP